MDTSSPKTGHPISKEAKSFSNIVQNFTDPREVIREAISNALDWGANKIGIEVFKDSDRQGEVVIQIRDDGIGLTPERFEAFWNLADSPGLQKDKFGRKMGIRTGEKGYGTKTYWKCRELMVESIAKLQDGNYWHVLGWVTEPINTLTKKEEVPDYSFVDEKLGEGTTFTEVTVRGFHVIGEEEFRHEVLKDYILWFTKFGAVETPFDVIDHKDKILTLQGLGATKPDEIKFGHIFPPISNNVKKLKEKYGDSWGKNYANEWIYKSVAINGYPDSRLDMIFCIEGDAVKRRYNEMLPAPGRPVQHWRYSVGDRYGIYVCKDYIPLPSTERINDWICPGRNEWTLYHAFVNCQDFRLNASRTSIGSTDRHFLLAVKETVENLFKSQIKGSPEYKSYQEEIDKTNSQRRGDIKESDEKEDIDKRFYHAKKKRIAEYHCNNRPIMMLYEPRQEVEVLILFQLSKQ